MSDENPQSETSGQQPPPPSSSGAQKAFDDLKDAARRAWEETVREAKQSTDDAMPKLKEGLQRAAAELIYDLAYATQFSSTVIKNVVPDAAADASSKGAAAGKRDAEEFLQKRREARTNPEPEPPSAEGSNGAEANAAG